MEYCPLNIDVINDTVFKALFWIKVDANGKASETLYLFLLVGIGIPIYVLLFPVYRIDSLMGILGTRLGLILPYVAVNISFNTLLFTGFLRDIPGELEEAAIIDGCNLFKLCTKVVIPVMKPTFVTIIIFNAVYIYNELWFRKTILAIANELIKVNKILKKVDITTSKIVLKYILEKSIVSIARW